MASHPIWILATALAAAALPAQRTIVVDASGNGDFLDIPPAVAAASSGDRIVVRAGMYSSFTVDKGLVMTGAPANVRGSISVQNLPADRTVVVEGFESSLQGLLVDVRNCDGRVQLQRIDARRLFGIGRGSIGVSRCRAVSLHACTVSDGIAVSGSSVSLEDCRLSGLSTADGCAGTGPGLRCTDSTVAITGGEARGGGSGYSFQCGMASPSPAISMTGGTMRIGGGAQLFGGVSHGTFSGTLYASAIDSDGGRVELDPSTVLQSNTAPPTRGTSTFVTVAVPALSVPGVPPAGPLQLELYGPGNALFGVLASPTSQPLPTPFGEIWLDPFRSISVFIGNLPASGRHALVIPLDPRANPPGTTFTFQGAAVVPGTLFVSVPATVTVQQQ